MAWSICVLTMAKWYYYAVWDEKREKAICKKGHRLRHKAGSFESRLLCKECNEYYEWKSDGSGVEKIELD